MCGSNPKNKPLKKEENKQYFPLFFSVFQMNCGRFTLSWKYCSRYSFQSSVVTVWYLNFSKYDLRNGSNTSAIQTFDRFICLVS